MSLVVMKIEAFDIRVPTSDTLLGSDPFHKKPNYSCVYTEIELNNGIKGNSVCFTSGAGNDWIAYGVKDISKLMIGYDVQEFIDNPGTTYKLIKDFVEIEDTSSIIVKGKAEELLVHKVAQLLPI